MDHFDELYNDFQKDGDYEKMRNKIIDSMRRTLSESIIRGHYAEPIDPKSGDHCGITHSECNCLKYRKWIWEVSA